MKLPLINNPHSGVQTQIIFDDRGKVASIVETQPKVISDLAIALGADIDDRALPLAGGTQRHMRHVAEIPNHVVNDLIRRGIWGDKKAVLKWLDGEGRIWKSYRGRVS